MPLPLSPPTAQDLYTISYHVLTRLPTTTSWYSPDQDPSSRYVATSPSPTLSLGPTLGSPSSFGLHPSKTLSRLEQSTTDCVPHTDSLRPTQSDGCFCHLLPFANRLPGVDCTFGRSTPSSPYLEDTSTIRPHGRPRPLSTGHRRVLQLRHPPPHGLYR